MQVFCLCRLQLPETGSIFSISQQFFSMRPILHLRSAAGEPAQLANRPEKGLVRVGFLSYSRTAQENCLRLMGKRLLVSLAMEGKLQADGLQPMKDDGDLCTAMTGELFTARVSVNRATRFGKRFRCNATISRRRRKPPSVRRVPAPVEEAGSRLQTANCLQRPWSGCSCFSCSPI